MHARMCAYTHVCMCTCSIQLMLGVRAELQIVFRYHGPNDPWLCKMMGQFSKGWVNDNLNCTHLQYRGFPTRMVYLKHDI